jgi:hypothetical protein
MKSLVDGQKIPMAGRETSSIGRQKLSMARAPLALLLIGLTLMACPTLADNSDPAANTNPTAGTNFAANTDHARYSAAALYNLANSYARAGKPAMAVLNYERARLLAPNDPDIDANLRHVREAAHLPAESRTRLERAVTVVSPTVVSWLGVIGVFMIGASLLAGRRYPRYRGMRFPAVVIGIALIGSTVANGLVLWPKLHEAVVLTAATPVRVSPVPMGDELFVLPEAETVRMTAEHEGFVLVHTKAGRTGWVSRANLVPVVPDTGAQSPAATLP